MVDLGIIISIVFSLISTTDKNLTCLRFFDCAACIILNACGPPPAFKTTAVHGDSLLFFFFF